MNTAVYNTQNTENINRVNNAAPIEKKHSTILTEVFESVDVLNAHESECDKYRRIWSAIITELLELPVTHYGFNTFCPYLQTVDLNAMKPEDYPNGIYENSMYLRIWFDLRDMTFEIKSCGHLWLTKEDQDASYLAMCSVKQAFKATGRKWMKKTSYKGKNAQFIAAKVSTFWAQVMEGLKDFSTGYPYHHMKINIYKK